MSATNVIAVIALVFSIGAGTAAILSLVLQLRESGRRNEEIRLFRAEAERRDEELRLLGQQVEAVQAERLRHEQAAIAIVAGVQASGSERGIEYKVGIQNTGASVASQIVVELVDGSSASVGTSEPVPALVPGEKAFAAVMTPPRDRYTGPYEIYFEWIDGRGPNRVASGTQAGAPAP